jgi:hypothetical protein
MAKHLPIPGEQASSDARPRARVGLPLLLSTWIVLLAAGLWIGPQYDYSSYMAQWTHVLAGENPWLSDTSNVYGVGHQILAALFWIHPLAPKALYILSSFGTFLVVFRAVQGNAAVSAAAFLLMFATPFFVILIDLDGVEDALVTFLTVLAVDLKTRKGQDAAPAMLLAAAVLTKLYPLALLPFLATDRGTIHIRFVVVFGSLLLLGLLLTVAAWGLPSLGIVSFAFERDGKMLSIFWFLSESRLSPIAHSALASYLITWNFVVLAAAMGLLFSIHVFRKMRALSGTVVAGIGLLAFYKVGNPQYFIWSSSLLIYFLALETACGRLRDKPLLTAAACYAGVLNAFELWYVATGASLGYPEVRAFIGLPAFVTAIAIIWLIVRNESQADTSLSKLGSLQVAGP